MKVKKITFTAIVFILVEFLTLLLIPEDYYVKSLCWSLSPPACNSYFDPSTEFFLLVALPFAIFAALGAVRRWKEGVMVFSSAGIALLVGLLILKLTDMPPLAFSAVLFPALLPDKRNRRVRETSIGIVLITLLLIWLIARMGTAKAI